jgi:hypothetical protein
MKQESGRSLIETIGVMAIAGMMMVGTIAAYNMIRSNQTRTIASAELDKIVEDTKILMEMRGTYEGISIDYLIKAGALKNNRAPIGGANWSIDASADGQTFAINLVDLTVGECEFFAEKKPKWANAMLINGFETGQTSNCFDSSTNQISFIVE